MALDVFIAHSYNSFALWEEWIPIPISLISGFFVLAYAFTEEPGAVRRKAFFCIQAVLLGLGLAGFYFHAHGAAFHAFTLKSMVYAAPMAAPLSFAGNALVALAGVGMLAFTGINRRRLFFLLTGAGCFGNFALCILDHARNGFFVPIEWASVAVSLFGAIVLIWAGILHHKLSRPETIAIAIALFLQIATGLIGFFFHAASLQDSLMTAWSDKIFFSAPIFAPLLFCDVAVLGIVALLMDSETDKWVFDS